MSKCGPEPRVPYPVSRLPSFSPAAGPADGVLDQQAVGRVEMGALTVAELDVDNARFRVRADPGHGAIAGSGGGELQNLPFVKQPVVTLIRPLPARGFPE